MYLKDAVRNRSEQGACSAHSLLTAKPKNDRPDTVALWMDPRIGAGVVLQARLLIGERVCQRLACAYATDSIFPAGSAAVIGHVDILLGLIGDGVVDDHISRRPSAGLEPGKRGC